MEEPATDQCAGEVNQSMEQVGPALVANAEAAAAEQPRRSALDHPAVPTKPLTGVDPTSRNPGRNAASTQGTA
jgi:hypothetical protein